jgi:SNF2 family DNA or RNA helicase
VYRAYLSTREVTEILAGSRNALAGIDVLRKICNHPDLLERQNVSSLAYSAVQKQCELRVYVPHRVFVCPDFCFFC